METIQAIHLNLAQTQDERERVHCEKNEPANKQKDNTGMLI